MLQMCYPVSGRDCHRLGRFAHNFNVRVPFWFLIKKRLRDAYGYGKIWSLVEIWFWLPIRM
jgi:hypothetical protein